MSNNQKHSITIPAHIPSDQLILYAQGKLSHKESHIVEKYLLENPFEADAFEGLLLLENPQLASQYVKKIEKALTKKSKASYWWYSAAASILLLVGLSYLLNVQHEKDKTESIVLNEDQKVPEQNYTGDKTDSIPDSLEYIVAYEEISPPQTKKSLELQDEIVDKENTASLYKNNGKKAFKKNIDQSGTFGKKGRASEIEEEVPVLELEAIETEQEKTEYRFEEKVQKQTGLAFKNKIEKEADGSIEPFGGEIPTDNDKRIEDESKIETDDPFATEKYPEIESIVHNRAVVSKSAILASEKRMTISDSLIKDMLSYIDEGNVNERRLKELKSNKWEAKKENFKKSKTVKKLSKKRKKVSTTISEKNKQVQYSEIKKDIQAKQFDEAMTKLALMDQEEEKTRWLKAINHFGKGEAEEGVKQLLYIIEADEGTPITQKAREILKKLK